MKKVTLLTTAFLLTCAMITGPLFAQSYNRSYDPKKLSQRLSYENFRNIKLLQIAILNYGGGKEDIDKLVDQYAEASALYFQDRMEEAADMFTQNQKQILALAKSISEKFKNDTEARTRPLTGKKMIHESKNSSERHRLALTGVMIFMSGIRTR